MKNKKKKNRYTYTIIFTLLVIYNLINLYSIDRKLDSLEDLKDYYSSNMTVYYPTWGGQEVDPIWTSSKSNYSTIKGNNNSNISYPTWTCSLNWTCSDNHTYLDKDFLDNQGWNSDYDYPPQRTALSVWAWSLPMLEEIGETGRYRECTAEVVDCYKDENSDDGGQE